MLKWLGIAAILLACGGLGRFAAARLYQRCRILAGLRQGLLALEQEISFIATPLRQALP